VETGYGDIKKLKGHSPPEYRLRVGKWRVMFEETSESIVILAIDNRGEAY
jgi:mRNA-degrading endonuclease RelE of RelBE toxin-antitoxin system